MKKKSDGTQILLDSIIKGIFEKKGINVLKIDLRKLENRITDYFVICHASSTTQVSAICDSVDDTARVEAGEKPLHIEGLDNCFWVLLDYGGGGDFYFFFRLKELLCPVCVFGCGKL